MNEPAQRRFYPHRRVWLYLACASPVLVLAGIWWLVTEVLLVPRTPDAQTPPDRVFAYIVHEEGLPRLDPPRAQAFFEEQVRRLLADADFRRRFLAEIRTATPDQQKAFRANLFDVFKPMLMDDIRGYHAEPEEGRQTYLDDRIVAYNRLSRALGRDSTAISAELDMLKPTREEALALLLNKTTAEERQLGTAYVAALTARVQEILADPDLEAALRARIDAP